MLMSINNDNDKEEMTIAMMMMMFSGLHRELSVRRVWEEDYWS